jgi:hypothetical protein
LLFEIATGVFDAAADAGIILIRIINIIIIIGIIVTG